MRKKMICTLFLIMLLSTMTVMYPAVASPVSGLVGLWHFDEESGNEAVDDSGHFNDGTIVGATHVVPGREGVSALHFDGNDDYIEVAHTGDFDFARDRAFTLGAWLKTGSSDRRFIIRKIVPPSPWSQGFLLFKSGVGGDYHNNITLIIRDDKIPVVNEIKVVGSTDIADGEWHYVLVTYDGSSKASGVQIYVDGMLETMTRSGTDLIGSIANGNPLSISGGGSVSWEGDIDEVRISHAEYHEENWVIEQTETLMKDHIFAEHAEGVIIDADDITLDLNGHKIIGKGPLLPDESTSPNFWYVGIHIGPKLVGYSGSIRTGVTITDTRGGGGVSNFNRGIGLWASNHNEIDGIEIHNNKDGIYFWFSSENTINSNYIHDNTRHGIKIFGVPGRLACLNQITNNEITYNNNGVFLEGGYANENLILDNEIGHNRNNGIRMWNLAILSPSQRYADIGAPRDNRIEGNEIHNNTIGIYAEVSINLQTRDIRSNKIRDNNICDNVEFGIQTDAIVDARYNWWGSTQGPTSERNKRGDGDQVSEFVLFRPWLRVPLV